jgi:hypothetical protein
MHIDGLKTTIGSYSGLNLYIHIEKIEDLLRETVPLRVNEPKCKIHASKVKT